MSTLYILEQGAALKVQHQQFHLFQRNQLRFKVPVNQIESIILFGYCHLSHGAVQTALFRNIPITYYSAQGYYLGQLQPKIQPKLTYLLEQIKSSNDDRFVRQQVRQIVHAKLHNSRIFKQD